MVSVHCWGHIRIIKMQGSKSAKRQSKPPFSNLCPVLVSKHCVRASFRVHMRQAKSSKQRNTGWWKNRVVRPAVLSDLPQNTIVQVVLFFPQLKAQPLTTAATGLAPRALPSADRRALADTRRWQRRAIIGVQCCRPLSSAATALLVLLLNSGPSQIREHDH